jgi:hypothetical protein
MLDVFVRLTGLVEAAKDALAAPAGTVTFAGTETTVESLLESGRELAPAAGRPGS